MSFNVRGENLELMWYRKALWILLAHENPVEVECRAKETEHGPYESVTENVLQTVEFENARTEE